MNKKQIKDLLKKLIKELETDRQKRTGKKKQISKADIAAAAKREYKKYPEVLKAMLENLEDPAIFNGLQKINAKKDQVTVLGLTTI
jgi:hypothetical protein